MKKQKLPIGASDFKAIREDRKYYIDKTGFINELLDASADVLLIPRPRRFGKTLNLSMLRYFFEDSEDKAEIRSLFAGLAISKTEEFEEHFGKYPVIYLTFKDIKEPDMGTALDKIFHLVRREFIRQKKKIKKISDQLDPEDLKQFENLISGNATRADYEDALRFLSELLFQAYGRKCIVLIDEYDTRSKMPISKDITKK